ncbi:Ppx/GppA phosphatase family protein [Intestinibacter bartlettii]|uniref:Ppx/GppA family phosphatase n=1 Tax=Intestinibacter bartlettii TaxID=261299 RepID=A0ABS6DZ84_9FIRM|nr:Ppx/GppA phosphatase family protein [Intestinibacter bartlettii]MBU5337055.1 Ppx/GppA family phosphatase [Intestinibacter bartlettii]MDO5009474.1 Ppx/GppA phosphatase family protein [Intestinibacter bartlettii]
MKIGTIDIGTNSMRLLTAVYKDGKIINRKKYVNTTRIGQGVDNKGYISKDAIDRNIQALKEFKAICDDEGCEYICCMGTSALRDSKNSSEFIELAKKEAGVDVEVITGERESNLGFLGVLEGVEKDELEEILVIDIGGGSTEFIVGDKDGVKFCKSENIGALRLTEKFLKTEIVSDDQLKETIEFIENTIEDTISKIKNRNIKKLVGIGGTVTSVSAINQKLEVYSMEKVHNSKICKKELDEILQMLKNMTLEDKKRLKGLQPKRADIITAGVVILDIIMEKLELNEIIVSEYDNLEGLMCQIAKKMS